jgi:hypothetical protein
MSFVEQLIMDYSHWEVDYGFLGMIIIVSLYDIVFLLLNQHNASMNSSKSMITIHSFINGRKWSQSVVAFHWLIRMRENIDHRLIRTVIHSYGNTIDLLISCWYVQHDLIVVEYLSRNWPRKVWISKWLITVGPSEKKREQSQVNAIDHQ